MKAPLPAGTTAPGFTLPSSPQQQVSLADFRGRPVVLAFYPADWSPGCGDQLTLYSELRDEFERLGAEVVGISVDGPWCHAAYAEARRLRLSLLADFEPRERSHAATGLQRDGTPTVFIDGIRYDGRRDEETLVAALELVRAQATGG
jgi:peroxiredoxin